MNSLGSLFSLPELPEIGGDDFARASRMLKRRAGIVLGVHKQEMVERALGVRANELGVATVSQYLNQLEQHADTPEWQEFINAFTINHTAFFRERHHFDILARFVATRARPLSIWSAACSTGEEPYSIAMHLRDTLPNSDYQVNVLATDIDTQAIAVAKAGVYAIDRASPLSEVQLKKHFQRGTGSREGMVRVKTPVRNMVEFDSLNLLDPVWPLDTRFDVVFCRNMLIYFDKSTQTEVLERFSRVMKPGGLLFAGHSENLTYLTNTWRLKGQTVYEVNPG